MKKYLQSLIVVIAVIAMVMVLVGPAAVQAATPDDLVANVWICLTSVPQKIDSGHEWGTTGIFYINAVNNTSENITLTDHLLLTLETLGMTRPYLLEGYSGWAGEVITPGHGSPALHQNRLIATPLDGILLSEVVGHVNGRRRIFTFNIFSLPYCPGYEPAHISGYIFNDTNGNGRRDNGEGMLKNSVVQLWQGGHYVTQASPGFPSGHFEINPQPGNYVLTGVLPDSSWHWTTKHQYGVNYNGSNGGTYLFGGAKGKATPPPQPTPTPPPCTPPGTYNVVSPPTLGIGNVTPKFPMVIGQGGTGFTLPITAQGGWAEQRHKVPEKQGGKWVCVEKTLHHYDDPIGQIARTVDLSAKSQQWIEQVLASYYWGATVQGYYPDNLVLFGGSKDTLTIPLTYNALDPGQYKVNVVLTTRGTPISAPQQAHATANVSVYLLTNTLWR